MRWFNSSSGNHSGYSGIIQPSSLTVSYCTSNDVARLLQVDEFGGDEATKPSLRDVEEWILEAQDDIDSQTHNAWRTVTTSDEMHTVTQMQYVPGSGYPIYLKHRHIKTLSTSDGDKIEIWDGSTWTDWVASSDYTEGRAEDYWVDYVNGILWMRNLVSYYSVNGARLTYRFGHTTVTKDIRRATSMMVAISVLETQDRTIILPEGNSKAVPFTSRINRYQEKVNNILDRHSEVLVPSALTD